MRHLTDIARKYFPDFNRRVHTLDDLSNFADSQRIIVKETDLIEAPGEYRVFEKQPFIFIHKFARENFKPWIFAHETGHFILHDITYSTFSRSIKRKVEFEANVFASVLLLPKFLLRTKTLYDLQDEYGHPKDFIMFRKDLSDRHPSYF